VIVQRLIGGIMAEHLENYKKLTPKQRVMVKLYTDETSTCYLKKSESFRRAGFCANGKTSTQHSAASRMFNSPSIIAAIREMAPKSWDALFVSNEMLENFNSAKTAGKLDLCHKILLDMGKDVGMFANKKDDTDASGADKKLADHVKNAQDLWRELQEKKQTNLKAVK